MAQTSKDFEDIVKRATATIKIADQALRYLRDQKRVLSQGDLNRKQEDSLRKINEQINENEAAKVEAKIESDQAKRLIPSLKSIENIDKQLEREYAAYDRAARTGGKPNKSRINQLLAQREGVARILLGYAPDAPQAPESFEAVETDVTAPTPAKTTLQADKTAAEQQAAEEAIDQKPAAGGKPGTGKGGDKDKTTAVPGVFDPAAARIGEEVSMGAARPPGVVGGVKRDLQSLLAQTEFWYDLPDYIFNLDPKLGELLVKAVDENWDNEKFLSQAKLTTWWQKNAAPVRQRIIAKAKFDELRNAGQDVGNTEYAMDTATIRRSVQARARQLGAQLAEPQLEQIVSKVYNGFLENDSIAIDSFIAPYIGKISSIVGTGLPGAGTAMTGFSGQALQNYQTLQSIARANGLSLRDVLPGISAVAAGGDLESAVLQKLATGELDINRIAQDARMIAATGQPEYVRNLLGQGYDLEQIYAPYRGVMASVLELNPEEIDLKELSGYGLFSDKGESNIFDFKRALRKDSRWQYTEQAKSEVADSVLGVLRDFGFQG